MRVQGKVLVLIAALLFVGGAVASTRRTELELYRGGVVDGVLVEKGTYKVEIAPDLSAIAFYKAGQKVASAPCDVSVLPEGALGNSVLYEGQPDGRETITRIILYRPGLVVHLKESSTPRT